MRGGIFVDCNENTRTINGKIVFDLFDSIEEWLEREVKDNDQTQEIHQIRKTADI